MQKFSENLLIEPIGSELVVAIQSRNGCDFRKYFQIPNDGRTKFCLPTDKFILMESEGILKIEQDQNQVVVTTNDSSYRLPLLKERGTFLVEPPVILPEESPKESWEYDFSGKTLNIKSNSNSTISSLLVLLGPGLVARNNNNVLEKYGDSSSAKISIGLLPYQALSKLGKSNIYLYSTGEVKVVSEEGEVWIKNSKPPLDLKSAEEGFKKNGSLCQFDLSEIKLKTFSKFILEKAYLSLSTGKISLVTESARKTVDNPELVIAEPLTLEIMAKDLNYLTGKVSVFEATASSQAYKTKLYVLMSETKDKTTYIIVKPTLDVTTW